MEMARDVGGIAVSVFSPPLRATAIEFKNRLDGGLSRPPLVIAEDSSGVHHKIVIKLRHPSSKGNHWGPTSLACELLCSIIARALGLSVPDYFIIDNNAEFANSLPDRDLRDLFLNNIGENFGTRYHFGCMGWDSNIRGQGTGIASIFENILSFDTAILNGDRKSDKPNMLCSGSEFFLIDHSLVFASHQYKCEYIEETCKSGPLFGEDEISKHCTFPYLRNRKMTFQTLLSEWQALVSDSFLGNIRAILPSSWETNKGDLDKIFWMVKNRLPLEDISLLLKRVVR